MFHFLVRNQIKVLFLKQGLNPLTTHLRFISKTQQEKPTNSHQSSLTASYLINSCGLSPQSALSSAKKINIKNTENPDSVLNVLKSFGFTNTHIAIMMSKYPKLLILNPDSIIKPKLEYFLGLGFSGTQLTELILSSPNFLMSSLDRRLKPNFDLLIAICGTNQQVATATRRSPRLLRSNLETNFLPNVEILRSYGVPTHIISKFVTIYPRSIMLPTKQFKQSVEKIKRMGFNPLTSKFYQGIAAMTGINPSIWEGKVSVFKSFGWSEVEIMHAFRGHPLIMLASNKKLTQTLDFFVKKMGWEPSFISASPVILALSFEKRILPRCCIINVLASKGLVSREPNTSVFLKITNEEFIDKYVTKYEDQVPEVLALYKNSCKLVDIEAEGHPKE